MGNIGMADTQSSQHDLLESTPPTRRRPVPQARPHESKFGTTGILRPTELPKGVESPPDTGVIIIRRELAQLNVNGKKMPTGLPVGSSMSGCFIGLFIPRDAHVGGNPGECKILFPNMQETEEPLND